MGKAQDSLLVRAMKGKDIERHPVWFMRQAGRYLEDYKRLKGTRDIFDVQSDPETASSITVMPFRRLGVDAAILYSDIMVPIKSMGYGIRIDENVGPIADRPLDIDDKPAIEALARFDCEKDAPYVLDNIRLSIEKLPDGIPLIGFSGGPFTLFSYLIEGKPSRTFDRSRALMRDMPESFAWAMERAADIAINYLKAQIKTGVDVVQLFDSWAGYLSASEYEKFVLKPTKRIFEELPDSIPKIYFSAKTNGMLESFAKVGSDFLSVDSRTNLKSAFLSFDGKIGLQGNLEPELAVSGGEAMEKRVKGILDQVSSISKFVFNLSHGVLKETNPDNLAKIVEIVKETKLKQD